MKALIISIKLLVTGFIAFVVAIAITILREMKRMSKLVSETSEPIEGVYILKDRFVNSFLIKSSDGYIAIDSCENKQNLIKQMEKLSIEPDDVKHLFLTHSDQDHTGGLNAFPNANIYLSQKEHFFIKSGIKRTFGFIKIGRINKLEHEYTTFSNEQVFEIGGTRIECIITSGHTPGSASFIIDDKYLFSGDTLAINGDTLTEFSRFISMDTKANKMSVKNLKEIIKARNIGYVFTAHHGYLKSEID